MSEYGFLAGVTRPIFVVFALPVISMLALEIVIPIAVAVGIAVFGVLVVELLRTRRLFVSLYRAGLTGAGGIVASLSYLGLEAAVVPGIIASAVAAIVYVAFVITAETLRLRYTTDMFDRGGRGLVLLPRVLLVMLGYGGFAAAIIEFNEMFSAGISVEVALILVLLALTLVVALEKLIIRTVIMRHRLLGMIAGVAALNASTFAMSPRRETPSDGASGTDAACDLTQMLCRAVSDTIGVESVTVRDQPARRGEIGVAVVSPMRGS